MPPQKGKIMANRHMQQVYDSLVTANRNSKARSPMIVLYNDTVIKLKFGPNKDGQYAYSIASRVCNYIHVEEIKNNVITKEKTAVLSYDNLSGRRESKEFPCDILSDKNKILAISRYGIDINSNNSADVVGHINNELRKASLSKVVSQAGMVALDRLYYVGTGCTYAKENKLYKGKIQYLGKLNIAEQGSYKAYRQMLLDEVVPSVFLSTALSVGISSLLVSFIGDEVQVRNLLVHISGDSSTGKSTALQLCISPYGGQGSVPEKTSLFSTWNTTDNALFEMLAGNYGIAVGLDEAGMTRNKNFASLIYRIVEGKEKQRMRFGYGNEDVREWRTTIISTGEIPLNDVTDQATGQKIRLLNFESVPWTDDAGHSERIKAALQRNYGFLGKRAAKILLKDGKDTWLAEHRAEVKRLLDKLDCGSLNARIAGQLALIVLSAALLRKADIPLPVKMIRELLCGIANETLSPANAMPEKAFEKLRTEIVNMQNQIEIRARNGTSIRSVSSGNVWGVARIDENSIRKATPTSAADLSFQAVYLPKNTVIAFLDANGFHNTEVIIASWKESGHIAADKNNSIIHKVKIGNATDKCLKVAL